MAQPQVRAAQPLVQLDQDPVPQRVVHALEEGDLALEMLDRLLVPALQRGQVPQPHVRAHDEDAFPAGQEVLLQRDRAARRVFAALEVPQQRVAVGELQHVPAGLRVEARWPSRSTRRRGGSRRTR